MNRQLGSIHWCPITDKSSRCQQCGYWGSHLDTRKELLYCLSCSNGGQSWGHASLTQRPGVDWWGGSGEYSTLSEHKGCAIDTDGTKVPLWVQFITKEKEVFLFASPFFFLFVFLFLFVSITRRNVHFGCENGRKKFSVSIHFAFPLFRGNVAWDEIEAESRIAPFGTSLFFQNTPAAIYFFIRTLSLTRFTL